MHVANGDAPYPDVADAIWCWPETATAVAARIDGGQVEVLAPHGIGNLVGLIVRPTPAFTRKMPVYQKPGAEKAWRQRWPNQKFVGE